MANSTTHLNLLTSSQASKEVTANALFDASSPSMVLGRNANTTSGLVWGYYGGTVKYNSALAQIANGTVNLTASTTNYVEFNMTTGAIAVNKTGWTALGMARMYKVVTGTAAVISYEDWRDFSAITGGTGGSSSYKSLVEGSNITSPTGIGAYSFSVGTSNTGGSAPYTFSFGWANAVSQTYTGAVGYGNTLSHVDAYAFGENNTSGANSQLFLGFYGHRNLSGTGVFGISTGSFGIIPRNGSWNFSMPSDWSKTTAGQIGLSKVMPSLQTTNATTTALNTTSGYNSSLAGISVRNNTTFVIKGTVIGKTSTAGTNLTSVWEVKGVYRVSSAGVLTAIGTPTVTMLAQDAGASAWAVAFATGTNLININVTGAAATTIDWMADLDIDEIVFA